MLACFLLISLMHCYSLLGCFIAFQNFSRSLASLAVSIHQFDCTHFFLRCKHSSNLFTCLPCFACLISLSLLVSIAAICLLPASLMHFSSLLASILDILVDLLCVCLSHRYSCSLLVCFLACTLSCFYLLPFLVDCMAASISAVCYLALFLYGSIPRKGQHSLLIAYLQAFQELASLHSQFRTCPLFVLVIFWNQIYFQYVCYSCAFLTCLAPAFCCPAFLARWLQMFSLTGFHGCQFSYNLLDCLLTFICLLLLLSCFLASLVTCIPVVCLLAFSLVVCKHSYNLLSCFLACVFCSFLISLVPCIPAIHMFSSFMLLQFHPFLQFARIFLLPLLISCLLSCIRLLTLFHTSKHSWSLSAWFITSLLEHILAICSFDYCVLLCHHS